MDSISVIDDLKAAHESHIQKLTQLHSDSLKDLQLELQKSRQQLEIVTKERDGLAEEVEGMRTEVEMLRGSFDLVQERLRRVLVDQDDLVKMVKLIEKEFDNKEVPSNSGNSASVSGNCKTSSNNNSNTLKHLNNNLNNNQMIPLKNIEAALKSREQQDLSTLAALAAIKYFKKIEASDPINLCRLLEVPFCPDRSFSLSTSLLASISVHMATDANAMKAFNEHPVYSILLNEIVNLRQDSNELCKLFLSRGNKRNNKKEIIAEISKWIDEKKENNKSILKLLIEETKTTADEELNSVQTIFSSVLSKFGI